MTKTQLKPGHSKFSPEEREAILEYIRTRHKEHETQLGCLTAAIEAAGATGKLKINSNAATRYFEFANVSAKSNRANPNRAKKLSREEQEKIVDFLRSNLTRYASMSDCFRAGLTELGMEHRLRPTSSAVYRYTKLAKKAAAHSPALNNGAEGNGPPKRRYTRKAKPVAQEITISFCPQCGLNLHNVAVALATANLH